ncbi:unnamed protein product [Phaeothamnion confervicola]
MRPLSGGPTAFSQPLGKGGVTAEAAALRYFLATGGNGEDTVVDLALFGLRSLLAQHRIEELHHTVIHAVTESARKEVIAVLATGCKTNRARDHRRRTAEAWVSTHRGAVGPGARGILSTFSGNRKTRPQSAQVAAPRTGPSAALPGGAATAPAPPPSRSAPVRPRVGASRPNVLARYPFVDGGHMGDVMAGAGLSVPLHSLQPRQAARLATRAFADHRSGACGLPSSGVAAALEDLFFGGSTTRSDDFPSLSLVLSVAGEWLPELLEPDAAERAQGGFDWTLQHPPAGENGRMLRSSPQPGLCLDQNDWIMLVRHVVLRLQGLESGRPEEGAGPPPRGWATAGLHQREPASRVTLGRSHGIVGGDGGGGGARADDAHGGGNAAVATRLDDSNAAALVYDRTSKADISGGEDSEYEEEKNYGAHSGRCLSGAAARSGTTGQGPGPADAGTRDAAAQRDTRVGEADRGGVGGSGSGGGCGRRAADAGRSASGPALHQVGAPNRRPPSAASCPPQAASAKSPFFVSRSPPRGHATAAALSVRAAESAAARRAVRLSLAAAAPLQAVALRRRVENAQSRIALEVRRDRELARRKQRKEDAVIAQLIAQHRERTPEECVPQGDHSEGRGSSYGGGSDGGAVQDARWDGPVRVIDSVGDTGFGSMGSATGEKSTEEMAGGNDDSGGDAGDADGSSGDGSSGSGGGGAGGDDGDGDDYGGCGNGDEDAGYYGPDETCGHADSSGKAGGSSPGTSTGGGEDDEGLHEMGGSGGAASSSTEPTAVRRQKSRLLGRRSKTLPPV